MSINKEVIKIPGRIKGVKMMFGTIMVKPDTVKTETASGLVLVDSTQKQLKGTVIAIGPGRPNPNKVELEPITECKVGDRVVYNHYCTRFIQFNGIEYALMNPDQIFCVIDED